MGIGHFAVGVALKRADARLNAGWLVFAALFADFLLGIFVFLGIEQVHVPADYASRHYLTFTFPYSHSLVSSILWAAALAVLAGAFCPAGPRRRLAVMVTAIAALSHFWLDAVVHVRGLPLVGAHSYSLGLGLWNHLAMELTLEVAMVVAAMAIYLKSTKAETALGRYGMVVFMALLTLMMVSGQALGGSAPAQTVLAAGWVLSPLGFGAIVFWLDRQRMARAG